MLQVIKVHVHVVGKDLYQPYCHGNGIQVYIHITVLMCLCLYLCVICCALLCVFLCHVQLWMALDEWGGLG